MSESATTYQVSVCPNAFTVIKKSSEHQKTAHYKTHYKRTKKVVFLNAAKRLNGFNFRTLSRQQLPFSLHHNKNFTLKLFAVELSVRPHCPILLLLVKQFDFRQHIRTQLPSGTAEAPHLESRCEEVTTVPVEIGEPLRSSVSWLPFRHSSFLEKHSQCSLPLIHLPRRTMSNLTTPPSSSSSGWGCPQIASCAAWTGGGKVGGWEIRWQKRKIRGMWNQKRWKWRVEKEQEKDGKEEKFYRTGFFFLLQAAQSL